MNSLREEITKTLFRLGRRGDPAPPDGRLPFGPLSPDPREGRQYAPYRIIRALGSGGMGQVYLALDTRLGRHVALKFLSAELTSHTEFLERFQQEAYTSSALNHPNIVTVYDFTEIDSEFILVTEFIEGVTLRSLLDRRRLEIETGLHIVAQAASALGTAHAAGIIHRDLKPSNLMIRPDGYVKVIDFGLAKSKARAAAKAVGSDLTQAGSVVGTVDYMSPEQARGDEVDTRTDIWSLGVVLYELVTGSRPFSGRTDSHVIVSILDQDPPPIRPSREVSPELAQLIERALAKDPAKRYSSADEMLSDLKKVQRQSASVPVTAVLPAAIRPAGPLSVRRLSVVGALLIAVASIVFWWFGLYGKEKVLGPSWFDFASSRSLTFSGDVAFTSISPDGRYVAYTSGQPDRQSLHLVDLRSGRNVVAAGLSAQYRGLTFSPDSQSLFYVIEDEREVGRLFRLGLQKFETGPPDSLLERVDGPLVFSSDGRSAAFLRISRDSEKSNYEVWISNEHDCSNPRRVLSLGGTQITAQLAWMEKGNAIATVTYPGQLNGPTKATVSIFDLQGRLKQSFTPKKIRSLFLPTALDGGSLLLFSGTPQGVQQKHLVQLFLPTGEFHESATDVVGFDSISATADSQTLATVRVDQRSTVLVAEAGNLKGPAKVTRDSEYIPQIAWMNASDLLFPSSRTGNMNLARLGPTGDVQPLGPSESCVQGFPNVLPSHGTVVYSANCGEGGDDFNIWRFDLKTGSKRPLTSGSSFSYQPDISADGNWVVYTAWSSNVPSIWKVPSSGGIPIRLTVSQGRRPYFSPDGKSILCQVREAKRPWSVVILDAETGAVLQRFPKLPVATVVRWSPDAKALDYVRTSSGSSSIWRQPLSGGDATELTNQTEDLISYFAWNPDGSKLAYVVGRQQRDVVLFNRRSQ